MASYSDEGFEQLAQAIRIELGIDDQIKVDPIYFLRRLKHAGYIRDYVRLPDSGLPGAEGMACTRFHRHRVRCFDGTGGGSWSDGSLRGSSSLRLCG